MMAADREIPQIRQLKKKPELSSIHDAVLERLGLRTGSQEKRLFISPTKTQITGSGKSAPLWDIGPTAVSLAFSKMRAEISPTPL
jgi:hypothetical protein